MALEIPNLDDKKWVDLVDEAVSLIPRVAPRWTDHNFHDPGITFLELFAWLAEMQMYQLNRVGQKHREVFGRLAGVRRIQRQPARVLVGVSGKVSSSKFLPAGTKLAPLETNNAIFETDADLFLTRSQLRKVITDDGSGPIDQTQANEKSGVAFLAFGENADEGAEVRLGFDAFYPNDETELRLTFNVFTDDLAERCGIDEPLPESGDDGAGIAPVELAWEFRISNDQWSPLELINDETAAFSRSGAVTLAVPRNAGRVADSFWIRARIQNGFYNIEPRLKSIRVNVLPCSQKETVRNEQHGEGNGKPDQSFELDHEPVLVPESDAKTVVTSSDIADWGEVVKTLEPDHSALAGSLRSLLDSGASLSNFGLIKELNRELQQSSVSNDTGALIGRAPVVIQVNDEVWKSVPSLENSAGDDKHYVFDSDTACVQFGNGLNGQIPKPGEKIIALWYQASNGAAGNVARNLHWKFVDAVVPGVTLTNAEAALGGTDPETLDEMELRGRSLLNRPQRAITLRDIELLALSTPHAFVARAKAITNCPVPESITVVAVPKSRPGRKGAPRPPSEIFLGMVQRNLQRYRLICDSLRVIGPVYVAVRVAVRLRLLKGAGEAAVIARARQALDEFLNGELQPSDQCSGSTRGPLPDSPCPTRWPFGRWVFPSEVYAILDCVTGVDFASNLVLSASSNGQPVQPDSTGAIPIPPVGLVFAGSHDITADFDPGRNG
jgi:hypothetical protein